MYGHHSSHVGKGCCTGSFTSLSIYLFIALRLSDIDYSLMLVYLAIHLYMSVCAFVCASSMLPSVPLYVSLALVPLRHLGLIFVSFHVNVHYSNLRPSLVEP